MNISVTIDQASLDSFVRSTEQRLALAKDEMSRSMASAFYATTKANIGDYGIDRPTTWPMLSDSPTGLAYRRKVERNHATLYVTGALDDSIKMEQGPSEGSWWVGASKTDCIYALAHQFGVKEMKLPARPYFPITDESTEDGDFPTLTPHTHELVMQAAREEFSKAFA